MWLALQAFGDPELAGRIEGAEERAGDQSRVDGRCLAFAEASCDRLRELSGPLARERRQVAGQRGLLSEQAGPDSRGLAIFVEVVVEQRPGAAPERAREALPGQLAREGVAAAAIGLASFVAVERRAVAPLVDLALFRSARFTGANVVQLLASLGTFGVFLYTSLFFQDVVGYSSLQAGAALLPWIATCLVVAPLTAKLAERVGAGSLVTVGLGPMAVGLLALSALDEHSTLLSLLPGLVVGGLGGALTVPLANEVVSAVFLAAQQHATAGGATAAHAFATGYGHGLVVAGVLCQVGAAIAARTLGPLLSRRRDAESRLAAIPEPA